MELIYSLYIYLCIYLFTLLLFIYSFSSLCTTVADLGQGPGGPPYLFRVEKKEIVTGGRKSLQEKQNTHANYTKMHASAE